MTTREIQMTRALSVLLLTTLLAAGTASATTLHFGTTTANPPFETVNGKISPRVLISIWPKRCANRCRPNANLPPGLQYPDPALRFKKFDAMIAGIEVIPMREKQVAFSQPYRQTLSGVVVRAKDRPTTFADLKDKKIGVVKGTLHQHYLRDKQKAVHACLTTATKAP
jgi:arginine transport system substrate-binding protein